MRPACFGKVKEEVFGNCSPPTRQLARLCANLVMLYPSACTPVISSRSPGRSCQADTPAPAAAVAARAAAAAAGERPLNPQIKHLGPRRGGRASVMDCARQGGRQQASSALRPHLLRSARSPSSFCCRCRLASSLSAAGNLPLSSSTPPKSGGSRGPPGVTGRCGGSGSAHSRRRPTSSTGGLAGLAVVAGGGREPGG